MSRLQRELATDGTKALGGKQPAPRKVRGAVYKARGGYWQDVESSAKTTTKRKRAEKTAASGEPATKRSRQTAKKPGSTLSKLPANDNEAFLRAAQHQLKNVKTADAKRIRPYLSQLRQPTEQEVHVLSEEAARRFLASDTPVDQPVFVSGGTDMANILDPDDDRRPIEQLFTWLTNDDETHDLYVAGEAVTAKRAPGTIKTAALRQRFQAHNGPVKNGRPCNLTDIASPFPGAVAPRFTQTPACNVLGEVMRYLSDCSIDDLCQTGCPNRPEDALQKCCLKHFLTTTELAELKTGWRQWQGAVMLAEAGALTQPHADKWGFAPNTSYIEGEIGWCWLADATDKDREGLMDSSDEAKDSGRWLYKVLRPGDALYMPPGTPHLVFRLPKGKQTMIVASHVVRRYDVGQWVRWLGIEARRAREGVEEGDELDESDVALLRGLSEGIEHILTHTNASDASYGGLQARRRAIKAAKRIHEQL
ncbi:hypothetical protein LTR36_008661 [Oleoguttula mirabilis]|uniref:JmjC domain-containing protein n=1 Tax=Oleoguttula mirabilis TaxID=1507867 RepID=A0AAV9JTN9_9PEZI|nr:hypothetical protein LTR36_008661 [Oleoguttula mirabilis]